MPLSWTVGSCHSRHTYFRQTDRQTENEMLTCWGQRLVIEGRDWFRREDRWRWLFASTPSGQPGRKPKDRGKVEEEEIGKRWKEGGGERVCVCESEWERERERKKEREREREREEERERGERRERERERERQGERKRGRYRVEKGYVHRNGIGASCQAAQKQTQNPVQKYNSSCHASQYDVSSQNILSMVFQLWGLDQTIQQPCWQARSETGMNPFAHLCKW